MCNTVQEFKNRSSLVLLVCLPHHQRGMVRNVRGNNLNNNIMIPLEPIYVTNHMVRVNHTSCEFICPSVMTTLV